MQRPVMDPTFVAETPAGAVPRGRRFSTLGPAARRMSSSLVRALFSNPLNHRQSSLADKAPGGGNSRLNRFCRGLLYRLAFLPVLIAISVAAVVYAATHPRQVSSDVDPSSQGIY